LCVRPEARKKEKGKKKKRRKKKKEGEEKKRGPFLPTFSLSPVERKKKEERGGKKSPLYDHAQRKGRKKKGGGRGRGRGKKKRRKRRRRKKETGSFISPEVQTGGRGGKKKKGFLYNSVPRPQDTAERGGGGGEKKKKKGKKGKGEKSRETWPHIGPPDELWRKGKKKGGKKKGGKEEKIDGTVILRGVRGRGGRKGEERGRRR